MQLSPARNARALLVSLIALSAPGHAVYAAEGFPSKPLRLVVPYPAGGPADTQARLVAAGLTTRLGKQVVVDNRGGGGGTIGVDMVMKSPPDGYTLLYGNDGPVAVNPSLYTKLALDPVRDLTAITQLTSSQLILVAHPTAPFKTVKELIAAARAQPDKLTFASSGSGNASHLAGELLKTQAGISLVHVPYKGAGPALNDLMGGQVHMLFNNLLSALPLVKAGKLRAVATTGARRSAAAAEVPTMIESGVPYYELALWSGVLAPARMPKPIVNRLHADIVAIVQSPEVSTKLVAQGLDVVASSPEAFAAHVKAEVQKWAKVVQQSGARVD
jgi:tripartite-type tricarboxylate transporter receptor subunit TctC